MELGLNQLLNCKDDTVLAPQSNGSAAVFHGFVSVLHLEDATSWGESRGGEVILLPLSEKCVVRFATYSGTDGAHGERSLWANLTGTW